MRPDHRQGSQTLMMANLGYLLDCVWNQPLGTPVGDFLDGGI